MEWIKNFHLFLFDCDGLLVDSEKLHYKAYLQTLSKLGFEMQWDFDTFCSYAHRGSETLQEALYKQILPSECNWAKLYALKKANYLKILENDPLDLMPGALELLKALQDHKITRCVVTNSFKEQTDFMCSKIPFLKTIPYWITREDYKLAKPDPECYQKAIDLFAKPSDLIIGFEDSLRGYQALSKTRALPILVCNKKKSSFKRI